MSKIVKSGLAVVEHRYWEQGNHSVKSLFELLLSVGAEFRPDDFRYDVFVNRSSLLAILHHLVSTPAMGVNSIYLAGHGESGGISTNFDNVPISVRDIMREVGNSRKNKNRNKVDGIYFAVCHALNGDAVEESMQSAEEAGLKWFAGYGLEADWVNSAANDMIFWNTYLSMRVSSQPIAAAKAAAKAVFMTISEEARSKLGYAVYYRKSKGVFEKYQHT